MMLRFLLLVSTLTVSPILALRPYRYIEILQNARRNHSSIELNTKEGTADDESDVQELYTTQRLDHFNPSNLATYQQRYFYTDRYVMSTSLQETDSFSDTKERAKKNDLSPHRESVSFLCVGGEGPGFEAAVLVDSVHCSGDMIALAEKLYREYNMDVHMYALEHRYYGKSYPVFDDGGIQRKSSPVETKNLQFLSSRQALEDLAHFVRTRQTEDDRVVDQHEKRKWITFGGSYPGYMAANARLKYPHLIHAAVSNSAPLDLQVDFPGYNERVGWDLTYEEVGGSQKCFDIVKKGHNEAVALLRENATELGELFNICDPESALLNRDNLGILLGDGLIEIYVQGNDPSCEESLCNVQRLCDYMIDASETTDSSLHVLANVARLQRGEDADCQNVSFQDMLDELSQPVVTPGGWRSWLWQTCTEVGFYQTCIHEACPYATSFHTVQQDLRICEAAFNITNVYENVEATRDYYGGLDISSGSRVLSVNGNVDPWSVLGLQDSPKYSLPVKMVPGASHHFWTHPVKDTDSREVQLTREYIYSVVMEWLGIEGNKDLDSLQQDKSTKYSLRN